MNPRHPIYIVSKGRWKTRLTSRALDVMGVPYHIVVEAHERSDYERVIDPSKVLTLPQEYIDNYDTFWPREADNKVGPGAARNFCWEHAISSGATWHWVMDDNLDAFHRMNRNKKSECETGAIFAAAEDFVERYENAPLAGFNYYSFCKENDAVPPFTLNTRIYSCLLIRNNLDIRWRGRYNEDTDLSLRLLKRGYCTIQFNAFLCGKVTTQRMAGGNTDEFYATEGTLKKSQILADMHPDVARVVWRFGRWHHHVDYRPFKRNALRRREGISVSRDVNNYNMVLVQLPRTVAQAIAKEDTPALGSGGSTATSGCLTRTPAYGESSRAGIKPGPSSRFSWTGGRSDEKHLGASD